MKAKRDEDGSYELELPEGTPIETFLKCLGAIDPATLIHLGELVEKRSDGWDVEKELVRLIHSLRLLFRIPDSFTNRESIELIQRHASKFQWSLDDLRKRLKDEDIVRFSAPPTFDGDLEVLELAKAAVLGLGKRMKAK